MMASTFSSFDPVCYGHSLKWGFLFVVLALVNSLSLKTLVSPFLILKGFNSLSDFLSILSCLSASSLYLALFFSILTLNLVGLLPFSFSVSSHLWVALMMAICMWLSSVSGQSIDSYKSRVSHLVPAGSPLPLSVLLVWIELVSLGIRPITLGVRLMANMVSGHILLHLSSVISSLSFFSSLSSLIPLVVLELAVAVIQAYVFSILTLLYMEEVS